MKSTSLLHRLFTPGLAALGLAGASMIAGCPGPTPGPGGTEDFATATGLITDDEGGQDKNFAGPGTFAAATMVRSHVIAEDGRLEAFAEGDVDIDGRYVVDVPELADHVVIQALDDDFNVLGAAVIELTGEVDERVTVTPLTIESSVEAAVLVSMIDQGHDRALANIADLRARIDRDLALEVKGRADADEDAGRARVAALARAVLAAQDAEVSAYSDAGLAVDQGVLFGLEAPVSTTLSYALDDGEDPAAAYAAFYAAGRDAIAEAGLAADDQARAESQAAAAFRAQLTADVGVDPAFVHSGSVTAAALEARALTAGMSTLFIEAGADADAVNDAALAGTDLQAAVAQAGDDEDVAAAFEAYRTSFTSRSDMDDTILGDVLSLDPVTLGFVTDAVDAAVDASAALHADIDEVIGENTGETEVDAMVIADGVTSAYDDFETTIGEQATVLSALGDDTGFVLDVMVLAHGAFPPSTDAL